MNNWQWHFAGLVFLSCFITLAVWSMFGPAVLALWGGTSFSFGAMYGLYMAEHRATKSAGHKKANNGR